MLLIMLIFHAWSHQVIGSVRFSPLTLDNQNSASWESGIELAVLFLDCQR